MRQQQQQRRRLLLLPTTIVILVVVIIFQNNNVLQQSWMTTSRPKDDDNNNKMERIFTKPTMDDNNNKPHTTNENDSSSFIFCSHLGNNNNNNDNKYAALFETIATTSPSHWWTTHLDDILHASIVPLSDTIQQASIQTHDDNDEIQSLHTITRLLLTSITPHMFQRGIQSRMGSYDHVIVTRIVRVLSQRIRYISSLSSSSTTTTITPVPPPLHMVVLGGSVTRGHGCLDIVDNATKLVSSSQYYNSTTCAWPHRLESMINTLFTTAMPQQHQQNQNQSQHQHQLVRITNLAVGATNIDFALPLIKYGLLSSSSSSSNMDTSSLPPPHVIICSYSTNEQAQHHYGTTQLEGRISNKENTSSQEWKRRKRLQVQDFVRACWNYTTTTTWTNNSCDDGNNTMSSSSYNIPPPLVVFVDDYLGNSRSNSLLEDVQSYRQVVSDVANYYPHVGHVSYPLVLQQYIYASTVTNATTTNVVTSLVPSWFPTTTTTSTSNTSSSSNNNGIDMVDNEYANNNATTINNNNTTTGGEDNKMAVHFGMGGHVVIAWTMLYAIVDAISGYCEQDEFRRVTKNRPVEKTAGGRPAVDNDDEQDESLFSQNVVDVVNSVLPPVLTETLTIEDVGRGWKTTAESNCNTTRMGPIPCAFVLVAGITATDREQIDNYLSRYVISNDGWESAATVGEDGYVKKLGLVATRPNATMTLVIPNVDTDVKVINVQHLKSYGSKWMDSQARFTVKAVSRKDDVKTSVFEIGGHHNFSTSVSYPFEYKLKEKAKRGGDIAISIDLVGGKTFKILGLMLCSK